MPLVSGHNGAFAIKRCLQNAYSYIYNRPSGSARPVFIQTADLLFVCFIRQKGTD